MDIEDKINIEIFKVITRAIEKSENVDLMATHLAQLLVGALEIKGSTIFILNPETDEFEILASFGMSVNYLNKGPVLAGKSLDFKLRGEPIVIRDVATSDRLQYLEDAKKEGISGIVSLPIKLKDKIIGMLRLYHYEIWDISEQDLDSLLLLAEIIGLTMMYSRFLNALQSVKDLVSEIHPIWLG